MNIISGVSLLNLLSIIMISLEKKKISTAYDKVLRRVLGDNFKSLCLKYPAFKNVDSGIRSFVIPTWNEWEGSMNEILQKELDGPTSIKMAPDRTFKPKDLQRLESDILESKRTNPFYLIESKMENFLRQMPDNLPTSNPEITCPTGTFIRLFWQEILLLWHEEFLEVLMKDLTKKFEEKMSLGKGFHNLSQIDVPQHLVEILKKGEKFSPHLPQLKRTYEKQFRDFIWNFITWSARVLFNSPIQQSKGVDDLDSILEELTRDENDPAHYFWWSISHNYDLFMSQLHVNHENPEFCSVDDDLGLISQILQPGMVCATADKNYGLVLLPAEAVRQAESKMLNDFGAEIINQNDEQIMDGLNCLDANLRKGYMSGFLKSFPAIPRIKQRMAFLKLNPKVHKLSTADLQAKKLDSLTFRPVCDSKFFTTKPCAQALGSLLISLKEKIFCLYPAMRVFYPLSGADVARNMRVKKFPSNDPFNLIISCDLSDAYSNVTLEDLIVCSQFLSAIVKNDPTDQRMIEELANFTLNSNFIECGGKIFKLKPVLPMGSCVSGDALDIVLMAGEIKLLINPPLDEEVMRYAPDYLSEVTVVPDFSDYERYRDDTKILASATNPQDIVTSVTAFARAACPRRIPISFEYSTFNQSFLSCCFFCNFSGRSFSTYPRLNFKRPSKALHPSSNTWSPQLFSGFISTMVDFSRICSDSTTRLRIAELLEGEMVSAGHSKDLVRVYRNKAEKAIENAMIRDIDKYDDGYDSLSSHVSVFPLNDLDDPETLKLYPPGVRYDDSSYVFDSARQLVSYSAKMISKPFCAPPPKNAETLKTLLASKHKYKSQMRY